jgi:hypothetical protein
VWQVPKFTPEQNEQYYRVRLDSYKLRHSKGMEYRAICPLHGGSNPTQLWVNLAEGNFYCFSCQAKGGSAYTFEQELLKAQHPSQISPSHDEAQRSLEQVMGTPFVQRTYAQPIETGLTIGWDRRQARDKYIYTDEDGEEVFTVWRFVDRIGRKITPPDHPCACKRNPGAECEAGCAGGRVWGNKGLRRVLYRLPDVMQSMLVFVVEGEKNADDLSRALATYISKHRGFEFGNMVLDRVGVTTNPGGAGEWRAAHGFGRYFFRKTVIKLGDNDASGRLHDEAACSDIAKWARRLFTLALPVEEGEDISDFLAAHTIDDFLKLLPQRVEWKLPKQTGATCEAFGAHNSRRSRRRGLVGGRTYRTGYTRPCSSSTEDWQISSFSGNGALSCDGSKVSRRSPLWSPGTVRGYQSRRWSGNRSQAVAAACRWP